MEWKLGRKWNGQLGGGVAGEGGAGGRGKEEQLGGVGKRQMGKGYSKRVVGGLMGRLIGEWGVTVGRQWRVRQTG